MGTKGSRLVAATEHEHSAPAAAAPHHGAAPSAVKTVRKSASDMTKAERTRFKQAWSWAVAKGYFDAFNAEHFDHLRNRQHGADVQAGTAPRIKTLADPSASASRPFAA